MRPWFKVWQVGRLHLETSFLKAQTTVKVLVEYFILRLQDQITYILVMTYVIYT